MGYEFKAEVALRDGDVALVREALAQDSRVVLLPSPTPTSLSVRWGGQPADRAYSDEDLRVSFDEGLYVVFHSATRTQRDELLRLLETQLAATGRYIRFEEL